MELMKIVRLLLGVEVSIAVPATSYRIWCRGLVLYFLFSLNVRFDILI